MNVPADLEVAVVDRTEIGDVVVLDLAATGAASLPLWAAGAHVDVHLPDGVVRQYSLCGTPGPRWRIAVLREPDGRGGSAWLHGNATVGARLPVSRPRNHFRYGGHAGRPVLLIAGGIGITPLLPMASVAAAEGADYTLHVAGHRDRLPFLDELAAAHGARCVVHAAGETARMDLAALLAAAPPGSAVYCCGPQRLLEEAERLATERGLDFQAERFVAQPPVPVEENTDFEVEFANTGITATVPPERSILEVAEENGVFVLSSCQEGTCGTCETPVLDGVIDHRDAILTPAERERSEVMYVCVSRAACPRIVLEL